MRLIMVEDTRNPNRAEKMELFTKIISFPRVMLICWGNVEKSDYEFFYEYIMNIHHLQTMLVTVPAVANSILYCAINKSPEIIGYTVATRLDRMQNMW